MPDLESDHNPVSITLHTPDPQKIHISGKITTYKHTDWHKFRSDLDNNVAINQNIKTRDDVDVDVQKIIKTIQALSKKHGKIVKINNSNKNLPDNIKNLLRDTNKSVNFSKTPVTRDIERRKNG